MTTIAFDGTTLAADTAMVSEGKKVRFRGKLRRTRSGLIGFCGDAVCGIVLMDWFEHGDLNMETGLPKDADTDLIHISKKGDITLYDCSGVALYIPETQFAMGSGGHLALGFMAAGGSAADAVAFAIKHDPNSGFDVISIPL